MRLWALLRGRRSVIFSPGYLEWRRRRSDRQQEDEDDSSMRSEVLAVQVEAAAKAAGLVVVASESGEKYSGGATTKFTLALPGDAKRTELLELSEGFEFGRADLMDGVK